MTYPLNPKHQRYADRLRQLIQEGNEVAKLERVYYVNSGPSIRGSDQILVKSWSVKTFNILKLVFGEDSTHYKQLEELMRRNPHIESSYDIYPINGILVAALDDLEMGIYLGMSLLLLENYLVQF